MTYRPQTDFALEVSKGNVPGHSAVQKFGLNNAVSTSTEDVWDGSVAWVAPTAARIHDIVSTDANDDGSPAGTGAQTIRIWGLTAWNAAEVSEDITMDGTTNVPTVNSYVIIHRMKVLTFGASGPNVGIITATAQTDATVTARIAAGIGQTRMAIYGVPDIQTLFLETLMAGLGAGDTASAGTIQLYINENPDVQTVDFLQKQRFALHGGTAGFQYQFDPPLPIPGPAIVTVRGFADSGTIQLDATFDGFLVDN